MYIVKYTSCCITYMLVVINSLIQGFHEGHFTQINVLTIAINILWYRWPLLKKHTYRESIYVAIYVHNIK